MPRKAEAEDAKEFLVSPLPLGTNPQRDQDKKRREGREDSSLQLILGDHLAQSHLDSVEQR